MIKNISECASYEKCSAPLCPLSEELDDCIFYPDEQVCNSTKFARLHWVRVQKRLKKYKVSVDKGYFTRKMLDDMKFCTRRVRGINPDSRKGMKLSGCTEMTKETPIISPEAKKYHVNQKLGHPRQGSGIKESQLVLV